MDREGAKGRKERKYNNNIIIGIIILTPPDYNRQ